MSDAKDVGRLYRIFYNRLKITVGRTGLTMMQDVRSRREWMVEMLRWNETAIFEELDEEVTYPLLIQYMNECGWNDREKEVWFKTVTGKSISVVE